MVKIPSEEIYGLVGVVDRTLYSALTRAGISNADEPSLTAGFEERVKQLFNAFRQKQPNEDVAGMEKAAMNGIPGYIQAAKITPRYNNQKGVAGMVSATAFLTGIGLALVIPTILIGIRDTTDLVTNNLTTILTMMGVGVPLTLGGVGGMIYNTVTGRWTPLDHYSKKYRNQIVDAFQS